MLFLPKMPSVFPVILQTFKPGISSVQSKQLPTHGLSFPVSTSQNPTPHPNLLGSRITSPINFLAPPISVNCASWEFSPPHAWLLQHLSFSVLYQGFLHPFCILPELSIFSGREERKDICCTLTLS